MKSILFFATLIALTYANNNLQYLTLFDDLLNDEDRSKPGHEVEYYCVRKYVQSKELITHTIVLNPKKIDVLDVNCGDEVRKAKNDAATVMASAEGITKKQKKCIKETFLKGDYFDAMAVVVTLGQLKDLTQGQISEERAKFVEKMREMTEDCNKCLYKKEEEKSDEKKKD